MKYIIIEFKQGTLAGLQQPYVFSEVLDHGDFARTITKDFHLGEVTGAGKCSINTDGLFAVYGKSVALGMDAKPEDAKILNYMATFRG